MLARVHSESPTNQILAGISPETAQLFTVDNTRREANTAPLASDLGVEIFFSGVTRDLLPTSITAIEPSASSQRTYKTAPYASSEPSKKQIRVHCPIAFGGRVALEKPLLWLQPSCCKGQPKGQPNFLMFGR